MEGAVEYEHKRKIRIKRCRYCQHEENRKCKVKPGRASVKLNKKRSKCKKYEADPDRIGLAIMNQVPVPVILRPDWYWLSKDELTSLASTLMAGQMVQSSAKHDPEHPVTGDLSRFALKPEEDTILEE